MDLKLKIYLTENDEKFMGIGVLWLLEKMQKCSSLRQAAKDMELSYSKAYAMIENLERSLGVKVVHRHKGGDSRDGASLTTFGQKLILLYRSFADDIKDDAQKLFEPFKQDLQALIACEGETDGQA